MASFLQEQILKRLRAKNLSISVLERKAGLKIHAVRNIIKGRVKKPSAHSLQAIAEALDCSLLDLTTGLSSGTNTKNEARFFEIKLEGRLLLEEPNLMQDCFKIVTQLINEKTIKVSIEECLGIIAILYSYTLREEPKTLDPKFAHWLIDMKV